MPSGFPFQIPTSSSCRHTVCRTAKLRCRTWWAQENRNKLDMVLDLTMPGSKEILGALLARADIWIESFSAGYLSERLRLTDEWALGNNPRLVVVHVSGFGQDGDPGTFMRASYDVIGQAFSGFMGINGDPDGPPMKSNPYANDYVTALFALWSALAAYIAVQRTGRGQVVDVARSSANSNSWPVW